MPAWQRTWSTTTVQNALPANANETVVAQLTLSDIAADTVISFEGWCKITSGTATTSIVPRLRRGGAAGTVINDTTPLTLVGVVGNTAEYGLMVSDAPGEVASMLYVLTIVQTAATGAGTLVAVFLTATG